MKSEKSVVLLLLAWVMMACNGGKTNDFGDTGDTIPMRYARNLTIVKYADRTEVTIRNPWDTTAVLHRYTLFNEELRNKDEELTTPHEQETRNSPLIILNSSHSGTPVHTPLRRAGIFTAVHCGLVKELGCESSIRGICEIEYINIPSIRQAVSEGRVANFGNAMEPTIEVIMDAEPDALMISPFENSGGYGRVERLGIPIIECADYMEYSPLARAEWMKFYGLLFGCPERADSLFRAVEHRYLTLKELVKTHQGGAPTLIVEQPYSGVWYVPGGGSVMGILYRDAGADYLYADRPETGSLPLSVETVFERGQRADVWLIKYNQSTPLTLSQLRSDYPPFAHFRAFQTGKVYGCNLSTSRFYEETPYHPDRLLADLIRIFHPTLVPRLRNIMEQDLGIEAEKSYFCRVE